MTLFERKQNALKLIAFASLKYNGEPTEIQNIAAETSRLSRIVADEYIQSSNVKDFNQFCLDWIKKNGEDFVKSDMWTYDIEISDDAHDLDVNIMIDKFQKKNFYSQKELYV